MKFVFTSYSSSPEYKVPGDWLDRINAYTGILEKLGIEHTVTGIERINYEGAFKKNNVQYFFIRQKQRTVRFPFRLHRLVKKLKPDVVFINGLIFPLQVIQLRLALGKKNKIILLHRGERPFRGLKGYLQKLADRMIDAYLFTSAEFGKEWMQFGNISSQKKIYEVIQGSSVFYPGEKTSARKRLGIDGSPVFLWVGRLNANKDPLTVVKAFLKFIEVEPRAKLYMIYQTEELLNETRNLIQAQKNANQSIRLVGKIEHRQLQAWYSTADFILSGSHHEGSGIAVCEAMSCGCIPIVTDIVSFRKMTGPGNCGWLYEPGNEEALLKILLQIPGLDIETAQAKTIKQFKEELSFDAIAKKIEQVLVSI